MCYLCILVVFFVVFMSLNVRTLVYFYAASKKKSQRYTLGLL